MRCLKRHLARRVWHLLQPDNTAAQPATTIHCNTPHNAFHRGCPVRRGTWGRRSWCDGYTVMAMAASWVGVMV
jgi:hypothetical protein